ncbi:hypothetical protein GCM10011385_21770 [Nitratireductor aestuarii]|uniref:Uncharacterized protein n=1 Tax=Nitratireductor aestuarii TaxID=1735103 RepID=A0A916RSZ4_9HYPH|nr:hypothetical protein GCM10011385_21770 [Nitratireductor aestuarii]
MAYVIGPNIREVSQSSFPVHVAIATESEDGPHALRVEGSGGGLENPQIVQTALPFLALHDRNSTN